MAIARGLSDQEYINRFFKQNPDFWNEAVYGGPQDTRRLEAIGKEKRNPQFRRLFDAGQLKGSIVEPEAASPMQSLESRLNRLSELPIVSQAVQFPENQLNNFNQQMDMLRGIADDIRSGKLQPLTTSPEQRQRIIDRQNTSLTDAFSQLESGILGNLNKRGLRGPSEVGQIINERQQRVTDPLVNFMSDLDIQIESERLADARILREMEVQLRQGIAGDERALGEFMANLNMTDLNSRRQILDSLLGRVTQDAQFQQGLDFDRERYEREQSMIADQLLTSERNARNAGKDQMQSLIGGIAGLGLGALTGGLGAGLVSGGLSAGQGALFGGSLGMDLMRGTSGTSGSLGNFGSLYTPSYSRYTPPAFNSNIPGGTLMSTPGMQSLSALPVGLKPLPFQSGFSLGSN